MTLNLKVFRSSLAVALFCASGAAFAQAYSAFSTDSIYGSLNHDESTSFNRAAASVLRNPQDGVVQLWTSPTKRRTPITGKLYADGSREEKGMPCRLLHTALQRGPNHENWDFWFCRVADGQWKVLSQTQK